jgi:acylphosphatase
LPDTHQEQLRAVVHGHVQGVSFRFYTMQIALRLGVTGWVQNRRDGAVELCAEGTRDQLERLCAFLEQGPPSAEVQRVELTWLPPTGVFDTFAVRHTGMD